MPCLGALAVLEDELELFDLGALVVFEEVPELLGFVVLEALCLGACWAGLGVVPEALCLGACCAGLGVVLELFFCEDPVEPLEED